MLSMKAKYALKALIHMAQTEAATLPSKQIAEAENIPQKFLDNILQELRQNGIVDSKRGIFGGYYLARDPKDIFLGDIIRIIDGPLAPIRCASCRVAPRSPSRCSTCVMPCRPFWTADVWRISLLPRIFSGPPKVPRKPEIFIAFS